MCDQQWIDKFAIQELIYSHCDAITRGDLPALESLYAPNAIWEHTPVFGLRTESARELFDFLDQVTPPAEIVFQTACGATGRPCRAGRAARSGVRVVRCVRRSRSSTVVWTRGR